MTRHDNDKIGTESEYDAALARTEKLWNAELGTPEGEELDMLVTLIRRL
jgi:HTH-type transcriptional regulator/antitoxin HigA